MTSTKEALKTAQKTIAEYIQLSNYLFSEDAPYDVNEIPEDNQFHFMAREISDDMGLDWETMSHEDSNRVMLNMLAYYFGLICPADGYEAVLSITYQKSK